MDDYLKGNLTIKDEILNLQTNIDQYIKTLDKENEKLNQAKYLGLQFAARKIVTFNDKKNMVALITEIKTYSDTIDGDLVIAERENRSYLKDKVWKERANLEPLESQGKDLSNAINGLLDLLNKKIVDTDRVETNFQEVRVAVDNTALEINNVCNLTEDQGKAISNIVHASKNVSALTKVMVAITEEQATVSSEVVKAVENVSQSANQVAAGTGEIATCAEGLATEAQKLSATVAAFRIS